MDPLARLIVEICVTLRAPGRAGGAAPPQGDSFPKWWMDHVADYKLDREFCPDQDFLKCLEGKWRSGPGEVTVLQAGGDGICKMARLLADAPQAFFSPSEAVELLDRGDRSILALTYRWLTAAHPDPFGSALAAVRRFLESTEDVVDCGLFWECEHGE